VETRLEEDRPSIRKRAHIQRTQHQKRRVETKVERTSKKRRVYVKQLAKKGRKSFWFTKEE